MKSLTADDFREALRRKFAAAERAGNAAVNVVSGELHRDVGVYPDRGYSMPACCNVMRELMRERDAVLSSPPKGSGATLAIRYALPRSPATDR